MEHRLKGDKRASQMHPSYPFTPSGDDIANVLRAAGRFKGQAVVTVRGMLAAAWVLWMVDVPLSPWWWLLVDALMVIGAGTACCKLYARARPPVAFTMQK